MCLSDDFITATHPDGQPEQMYPILLERVDSNNSWRIYEEIKKGKRWNLKKLIKIIKPS